MTSEARIKALQEYMDDLKVKMGFTEWQVEVTDEAPQHDNSSLEIHPQPLVFFAHLRIGGFFRDDGSVANQPDDQRRAAVHEIVHLAQARLLEWLNEGMLKGRMSKDAEEIIEALWLEEIEIMADRLAGIVAPHMPLPPEWPEG